MQKNSINAKFVSATPIIFVGEKQTKVRTIVVDMTENPQYPNTPTFQLIGDRVVFGDQLNAGDDIRLDYVIEARSYQKDGERKSITNLNVINIFKTSFQSLDYPANNPVVPVPTVDNSGEEIF